MEDKQNLILGGMGVMFLWLCFLTYNVFSGGVDDSTLAQTRALTANNVAAAPAPGQQSAIKPTNTQTQPKQPEVDPATAATMEFSEIKHDFGTIQEGEKVEHVFKFTNTSTNPLTIQNARGSCGCTVPEWPKEPIAPGASSEIRVKFDSKGKKGQNNKNVTITANTIPANTVLTIAADVIKLDENGNPVTEEAKPTLTPGGAGTISVPTK